MHRFKNAIEALALKPSRKLVLLVAILGLLCGLILTGGSLIVALSNQIIMMESSLSAMPTLVDEQLAEIQRQYDVFNNDFTTRGDLSVLIYNEFEGLPIEERIELARENVYAESITVMNEAGDVVAVAGAAKPSIGVTAAFKAADEEKDSKLFDPNVKGLTGKEMLDEENYDPETDSMPMVYKARTDDGNILFAEFDYTAFGKVYAGQASLSEICRRGLAGMEGCAFVLLDNGSVVGYTSREVSPAEEEKLYADAKSAFKRRGFDYDLELNNSYNSSYMVGKLLDERFLMVKLESSVLEYDFILAIPESSFIYSMVQCILAVFSLVLIGFYLFICYAVRCFRKNPVTEEDGRLRARQARVRTLSGALLMVAVTGVLSCMLFMLEGMATTAQIAMTQQESLKYETEYRIQRKSDINEEYSKRCTTRSDALAVLLSGHPELRSRGALQRLCTAVGAEYLMLFDKDGNEIVSSNGYTGFSFSDATSGVLPEWKPVLQGYWQVETPTVKNEVTGTYERTIATVLKDADDMPDGMLVMVVNDDEYMAEIGDASVEGAIKSFTPPAGQMACVVDNETGEFVAHTNSAMVGESAEAYLDKGILYRDYEGYTTYDGEDIYASCISSDGKTSIVFARDSLTSWTSMISWYMIVAILFIALFIFYPIAAPLCSDYALMRTDLKKTEYSGNPLLVFYRGYVLYLALLAVVSVVATSFGLKNAADFVFNGKWTPGLHLFSVWSALFIFALFSYVLMGLHRIALSIERAGSTQTKTYARLIDSLATYMVSVIMLVYILTVLGVNTAAIIGSVSIVSIAIGMGTQDLVKDIVAGLFLVFESTISVGDIIEVGGWRGRVTDMGIRTTEVTNEHNDVKIVTNSSIANVVNYSKVKTLCAEEFEIPRMVEIKDLPVLVDAYIEAIVEDVPEVKDSLDLDEIMAISENSYTVRLSYKVNESERESVTIRLRNAMQLLLESGEVSLDDPASDEGAEKKDDE